MSRHTEARPYTLRGQAEHRSVVAGAHVAVQRRSGRPVLDTPEQVRANILRRVVRDPDTGCLLFQGCRNRGGYGRINCKLFRHAYVHRVMWLIERGEIRESLDHLCRHPNCVNTEHMEDVPIGVNVLRGQCPAAQNARKKLCKRGHPFDALNTRINSKGERCCRTCQREYERERVRRLRAAA